MESEESKFETFKDWLSEFYKHCLTSWYHISAPPHKLDLVYLPKDDILFSNNQNYSEIAFLIEQNLE